MVSLTNGEVGSGDSWKPSPPRADWKTDERDTAATCLDEACMKVMLSLTSGEVGSRDSP
jgi:hypothetical protein